MLKHVPITLLLLLIFTICAHSQQRTLEIAGTRNYSEDELFDILHLERYEFGRMTAKEVIDSLVSFYSGGGYTLVKIYVVENSDDKLGLYIDEGALGKIVFLNMDDFTTIYLMLAFRLKNKIFNIVTVRENIEKLRKTRAWKKITYQLRPVKEYDTSIFQLDRELNLPLLGRKQLPFFDRYPPRYDLMVHIQKEAIPENIEDYLKKKKEYDGSALGSINASARGELGREALRKRTLPALNRFDYGLKVHFYKGFIPFLKYYHIGLISPGDFFMAETSLGVMYGIDRRFSTPPRITYYHFNTNYFFTPTLKEIFTPHVRLDLYYSRAARPDLALLEYHYLILDTMLAPGITLFKKINLYTGFGAETVFFFNSKKFWWKIASTDIQDILFRNVAKDMEKRDKILEFLSQIEKRTDVYCYFETGVVYDFSKIRTGIYELKKNRLRKEIALIYNLFFLENVYNRIRLNGNFDHEFKNRNIYSGMISYQFTFTNTPFYQEASVSNPAFKGLNGSSYFSRHLVSQSNEYRISIYRDFLYIGAFFDMTLFEGSGRDLRGVQFAFSGGPTGRILLLDHFEIYLHYSFDLLASRRSSHQYFHFNIQNRW